MIETLQFGTLNKAEVDFICAACAAFWNGGESPLPHPIRTREELHDLALNQFIPEMAALQDQPMVHLNWTIFHYTGPHVTRLLAQYREAGGAS